MAASAVVVDMEDQAPEKQPPRASPCAVFVWLIFGGGLIIALAWLVTGIVGCFIAPPYGYRLITLIPQIVLPQVKYTDNQQKPVECGFKILRLLWILVCGIPLTILHIAFIIVLSIPATIASALPCVNAKFLSDMVAYHSKAIIDVTCPYPRIVIDMRKNHFNMTTTAAEVLKNADHMAGKVIIVTGANSGLGKEASKQLYIKGAIVVMACRNQEKAAAARDDIINESSFKNADNLILMKLDLGSLKSIDEFVEQFNANERVEGRIDVLLCNAGVMAFPEFGLTADGIEKQFGINHMGHFYLVNKLLPILKQSKSRIVNLASCGHYMYHKAHHMYAWLDLKNENNAKLQGPTPASVPYDLVGYRYYGISKMCNVLFARHLNEKYNKYGIVALALHPGMIMDTGLAQHTAMDCSLLTTMSFWILSESAKPKNIPQGAATSCLCVSISDEEIFGDNLNDVENMNLYFDDVMPRKDKIHREFQNGQKKDVDRMLWEYSCEVIKSKDYLQLNDDD